jgi:hypothetical protein
MTTRRETLAGILAGAAGAAAIAASAAQIKTTALPAPRREGGQPLLSALNLRRSTRAYSSRALTMQTLSDLLWAAFGVNRPSGDRTAPYWRHIMVIDIYLAMADGVWFIGGGTHNSVLVDFKDYGRQEVEHMAKILPKGGNLLEIRGLAGTRIDASVHEGILEGIKAHPDVTGILARIRGLSVAARSSASLAAARAFSVAASSSSIQPT